MEVLRNLLVNIAADSNPLSDLNREMNQMNSLTRSGTSEMSKMNKGSGLLNKTLKGVAIGAGAAAAAFAGVGAGVATALAGASKYDQAMRDIQVTTGATTAQMKEMKEISKDLYNKNLGEDWNDLAQAVSATKSVTNLAGKELRIATENAIIYHDTFGEEIPESIKVADTMMKNFGITNTQSFNLLAQGAQKGLNKSGELLDSANEYSPQFAALGFNAGQMFDVFNAGLENGAFNLDKVGDAVKEFNIRSKDGSKASADAYKALGMNAAKMTDIFAAGGPKAKKAFDTVVQAISNVKDPAEKTAISVGLFGTQAEDLESTVIAAMGGVRKQFDMTRQTMESIGEIKYESIGQFWKGTGRQIETGIVVPISEKVLPVLNLMSKKFAEDMPAITATIETNMDKAASVISAMPGLFSGTSAGMVDFQSKITKAFGHESGLKIINFFLGIKDGVELAETYLGKAKGLIGGVVAAFQGNTGKSAGLLSLVGLSQDSIRQVQSIVSQIVDEVKFRFGVLKTVGKDVGQFLVAAFNYLAPIIIPALQEVLNFAGGVMLKIRNFWESDGQQLMAAVGNVFRGIFAVIKFIMPAVQAIIKMVWGNIKGVINGALNVIMGAVKIFSGLFTGDFGKMWEGVKQLFKGAVEFIWNFVQLTFYGKILGGVKAFALSFRGFISSLWGGIVSLFKGGGTQAMITIQTAWQSILRLTKGVFVGIWTFIRDTFTTIKNITSGSFNVLKSLFTGGINTMSTKVRTGLGSIKTWFVNIFRDIVTAVRGRFNDVVNLAKSLPQRIGDGIGAMASKVNAGVTKVINKLAETLGKGVNGVIGGINTVLGWIGVDGGALISTWPVPQWANGTGKGSHPGGPALINDGKGSNAGRELIRTPDGKMGMFNGKNVIANLPKGTQVLSATDTRGVLSSMPQYNSGTEDNSGIFGTMKNIASDLYSGAKNIGGKVVDAAFNVFDYIKNPNKLLSLAMDKLGISSPEGGNFIGDMAKGAFNKVKGSAIDFVKKKLDAFSAAQSSGIALTGGNGGGFGAPFRLTSRPGPRNTGIPDASRMHKGWDWAAPVGTPIPSVSNGIVTRNSWHPLSGKFVEISSGGLIHRYQHNSRNAVNVGQQVMKGQTVGYVGSTGVSSGPHLHYEVKKGFAKGTNGPLKKATTAWVGERGPELMRLNAGTEIFSNNASKRMEGRGYSTSTVAPSGGGSSIYVPVTITIEGNADRETASMIGERVRSEVEEFFASMNRRYSFDREG